MSVVVISRYDGWDGTIWRGMGRDGAAWYRIASKAAREKMIEEKKRLLSDGYISEEETRYFMKKYK